MAADSGGGTGPGHGAGEAQHDARDDGRVRLRLLWLGGLGYGVLAGLLGLALAPLVLVAVQLFVHGAALAPEHAYVLILPTVLAALVLRALVVRFLPPQGIALTAAQAPALHAEIERLRLAAGAPPLAGVLVDGDLNAQAASVPRMLGLLGHRHYLVLGLPLLRVLDRETLAAVVAHEFGHFSAADGAFARWVYFARGTWYRLCEGMAGRDFAFAWLLGRFYAWLAPRFDRASRALTRRHEYAADAVAGRIAGAPAAADALLRVEIAARRLQVHAWALWARARQQAHPPAQWQGPLAAQAVRTGAVDLARLLATARREHDPDDTHPSLPQRLRALGVTPQAPGDATGAATDLLPAGLEAELERRLDAAWRDAVRDRWDRLHAEAAPERARLAELEARGCADAGTLAEHARLVERLRIDIDPLPFHARALAADPDCVPALFHAGLRQLRQGDAEAGAAQLAHAWALDAGIAPAAMEALRELRLDPDLDPRRDALVEHLCAQVQALMPPDAAKGDTPALLPHDLDDDGLRRLRTRLASEARVARAWVVRRPAVPGQQAYLVLLDWRGSVASEPAALARLAAALGGPAHWTLTTGTGQRALAETLREVCGAPVYRRGG